jgi:hypothetical protein
VFVNDLGRVSQQVQSNSPGGTLNASLYDIFKRDYPLTSLHRALAALPAMCEPNLRPVFITTNYDTMMEQALAAAKQPFDVIYYRAPGPSSPSWLFHWKNALAYYDTPEAERDDMIDDLVNIDRPITDLTNYLDLPLGGKGRNDDPALDNSTRARTLVVKIHGTVSPKGWEESSFIITPDDYVQFFRLVSLDTPLPRTLVDRLLRTHFLFLGYGLGDWNILAICQKIWEQRQVSQFYNWAVQWRPSDDDVRRWSRTGQSSNIEVFDQDVTAYAKALASRMPQNPLQQ